MKKIFIALPTKRYIEPEAEESLRDFVEYYKNDTFFVTHKAIRRGSPNVYYQRYNLAMDFLKTEGREQIQFDIIDSVSPAVLRAEGDEGYLYVVMPVKV